MKLTKKQKAKWLKALRSGEYSQATGTLYDEETKGFCCLGVLQHCLSGGMVEYDDPGWLEEATLPLGSPSAEWYEDNGILVRTIGGDDPYDSDVAVKDDDETLLMNMNDGSLSLGIKKRGFRGIAQWIERNVETLD